MKSSERTAPNRQSRGRAWFWWRTLRCLAAPRIYCRMDHRKETQGCAPCLAIFVTHAGRWAGHRHSRWGSLACWYSTSAPTPRSLASLTRLCQAQGHLRCHEVIGLPSCGQRVARVPARNGSPPSIIGWHSFLFQSARAYCGQECHQITDFGGVTSAGLRHHLQRVANPQSQVSKNSLAVARNRGNWPGSLLDAPSRSAMQS